MIPISAALQSLFSSSNTYCVADLYTLTLISGTVLRYTSADLALAWSGNTYACSLKIERGKMKRTVGVEVDDFEVTIYPSPTDVVGSNEFAQLAVNGGLDGCYLQFDRAFLASWSTGIVGVVPKLFYGRIAGVQAGRSKIVLTVKSDLDLLNIQVPRVVFQPACTHNLYDGGCTLSKVAFTTTGHVTAVTSASAFATSLSNAPSYYSLGALAFTSGVNSGLSQSIKGDDGSGNLTFPIQFPNAPAIGDTFTIYPGCDKRIATCSGTFNNLQNFRGFPEIPNPETAVV